MGELGGHSLFGRIIPAAVIYTYYYGVICASKGCDQFNAISSYHTTVRAATAAVDFESPHLVVCRRCGFQCG